MDRVDVKLFNLQDKKNELNELMTNYKELCNEFSSLKECLSSNWEGKLKDKYLEKVDLMNKCVDIGALIFESTIYNLNDAIANYEYVNKKLESETDEL